jgi:ABC-type glycerol-3-phosphate transport system permease component
MDELFACPPRFFVHRPTMDNFTKLMKASRTSNIPISRYVFNSLIITVATVIMSVIFSTMAAFSLSKLKYKGRDTLMQINQIALMFVPVAVMIPRYMVVTYLHLTDTYWAHILPIVAYPVALFLIKQFVDTVPDALIEAAYMDGATELKIYTNVILPLIKPAIATGGIMIFQQVWVNMETSNYYVNDESLKNLAFYMNTIANLNNTVAGQGMAAAASLIMFLPQLIVFIILQNSVMNTMATSGIK